MTFTLAAEALVGFRVQPKEYPELLGVFEVFANNLFCLPLLCPGMGLAKGMSARKLLLKKIQECLESKKRDAAANQSLLNSGEGEDALSRLMKASGEDALTDSELKDLSLELLFAGHATTASAATSLVIKLHEHSDVLEKVLRELDGFGLVAGEQRDLTLAQLRQLEYTGAVIKEVLRLLPPIGGGFRKVIKTFELNGYQIPEGWTVAYSIRETHQTSPMFPNNQQFNPDRWLAKGDDEKFHYLPFGGGPRMCVGREFALLALRVFVVELVRSSTWSLMNGECRMSYLPVPHPVDGLPVRFTERDLTKRQEAAAI
ncbi:unnamed protein product [Lymnaea stagnalis]|uniref:Cytochrome P450 n=1 Tax=Lymnaea stagnalis TaxID=6523 RepID=A0AAV2IQA6_LYMST